MPSTNKTPILGLNQWIDTDKPVREDFDRDNRLIEEKVAILSKAGATGWDSGNMIVESGTWSAVLKGTTSSGTADMAISRSYYVRQGNTVTVNSYIEGSLTGGTGRFAIYGLPFPSKPNPSYYVVGQTLWVKGMPLDLNNGSIVPVIPPGGNYVYFYVQRGNNATGSELPASLATASVNLYISLTYSI